MATLVAGIDDDVNDDDHEKDNDDDGNDDDDGDDMMLMLQKFFLQDAVKSITLLLWCTRLLGGNGITLTLSLLTFWFYASYQIPSPTSDDHMCLMYLL